jgi:hypothetical protein
MLVYAARRITRQQNERETLCGRMPAVTEEGTCTLMEGNMSGRDLAAVKRSGSFIADFSLSWLVHHFTFGGTVCSAVGRLEKQ